MAQLFFERGGAPVFRIFLPASSTKLGRAAHCDIVLGEPEISREHAAIYKIEGKYYLKKLGQGALLLNGREVESQTLKEGDTLGVGPWRARFVEQPAAAELSEADTALHGDGLGQTQAVAKGPKGLWVKEWRLQIHEPSRVPKIFPLNSGTVTLGAAEQNDVVIQDDYVSSRHLKLAVRESRVWLYDLGSTNGTFVNGVRVKEAELEEGQIVKLGQCEFQLSGEDKLEATPLKRVDRFCGLVGGSVEMRELYGLLERIGPTEATALILGESGTGKELVARALHGLSGRAKGPLVAINCGAISSELIESELFGHEKGAFTGALRQHDGAFGQARGGTLFLDEVGELPVELQPKLLRVLENRTYRRIGGVEELTADVRVVAATHRDLAKAVQGKRFREDLFFRLFVMPIHLPPLRDRREDIPMLCEKFLEEFRSGPSMMRLDSEALEKLKSHAFPGNIRELRNVLLRAVILGRGEAVAASDIVFPQEISSGNRAAAGVSLETLEEMEKRLVLKALTANAWNKARAAEALGVAKSTLFAKIKLYDLKDPREES